MYLAIAILERSIFIPPPETARTLIFLFLQMPQPVLVLECVFRVALEADVFAEDSDETVGAQVDEFGGSLVTGESDPLSIIEVPGKLVPGLGGNKVRGCSYTRVREAYNCVALTHGAGCTIPALLLVKARTSRLPRTGGDPLGLGYTFLNRARARTSHCASPLSGMY